jgi:hypothetical protein
MRGDFMRAPLLGLLATLAVIFSSTAYSAPKVMVKWIETTQGIQSSGSEHQARLIAGKRTLVRAYFYGGSVTLSTGILVAQKKADQKDVGSPLRFQFYKGNVRVTPGASPADLQRRRGNLNNSLYIELPKDFDAQGTWEFQIESLEDKDNKVVACGNCTTFKVRAPFDAPLEMRLVVVRLRYRSSTTHKPLQAREEDVQLLYSWLKRAYPISSLSVTKRTEWMRKTDKNGRFSCSDVNAWLRAIAKDDGKFRDPRTRYYALVYYNGDPFTKKNEIPFRGKTTHVGSDGSFFMRGCSPLGHRAASGPTGDTGLGKIYNWDLDGSWGDFYGGHELGHTYGRIHAGRPLEYHGKLLNEAWCNAQHPDPHYPYSYGRISDARHKWRQVGVDMGDQVLVPGRQIRIAPQALPGTRWTDVMSYCRREWISDYTYNAIMKQMRLEDRRPTSAPAYTDGRFLSVTGTVNLTRRTGEIQWVKEMTAKEVSDPASKDKRVQLRMFDRNGKRIVPDVPMNFFPDNERLSGEDEEGVIDLTIDMPLNLGNIELLVKGKPVPNAKYDAGSVPANWAAPTGGTNIQISRDDGLLKLQWASLGSNYRYQVQVRRKDSNNWETFGIGLESPTFDIDLTDFTDAPPVEVRINATLGFVTKQIAQQQL